MEERAYTISMLVANKPSVTSRVTGLFAGRGYNMESICGAPTHDPNISRITIKTRTTPEKFEGLRKQLDRLIDVIKLRDMSFEELAVQREMALISIEITPENTANLAALVESTAAKIINESADSYIIEVTGYEHDVDELIEQLRPFGIKKLTRSGVLALYRELDEEHRSM